MPLFDITFLRVDRDKNPTAMDVLSRAVDWPLVPREGEGVEIAEGLDAQTVESVGYDLDGVPSVHLGRVVLDDLQVKQLRKAGWRVVPVPGARALS
jgi:hypothetical protein